MTATPQHGSPGDPGVGPGPDYVGRFAPSPTGPLHFGSLVSAVASYLDARSCGGKWLLRVEDIDPPREQPGAAATILRQLEQHGLWWDAEPLYQSSRLEAYREILELLKTSQQVYPCSCSRQQLQLTGGVHRGCCYVSGNIVVEPHAWRVSVSKPDSIAFHDLFQGVQHQSLTRDVGDFVLLRKDGLFAYQLAVVVDEKFQGVTHIVRGADLLDSTPRQIYLQRLLGYETPVYGHIPVAVDKRGEKLSKQNFAPSLDGAAPTENLANALAWLGITVPEKFQGEYPEQLLSWAAGQWRRDKQRNCLTRDAV